MGLEAELDAEFGTVTLSLSSLLAIQLIVCGVGMFIAGFVFLCIYEPKLSGPLQVIMPLHKKIPLPSKIKKLTKKKKKQSHLSLQQQKQKSLQESKRLMSCTDIDDAKTDIENIKKNKNKNNINKNNKHQKNNHDDNDGDDEESDIHDHNNNNLQIID